MPETITVSLEIDNTYEDGDVVITHVADKEIPAPPDLDDRDALNSWAYEHVFPFTGTGREEGDSWYYATVTASSNPQLVGRTFEFGF